MDLSKCGEHGAIIDKRAVSVEDAGEYLALVADCLTSGKPVPLIVAMSLAPAFQEAARLAREGKGNQKAAISALAEGVGLQSRYRRPAAPFWAVVGRILDLMEGGYSQTKATTTAAKEQGIGKQTAEDYWTKYQGQADEVCRKVEVYLKEQSRTD